MANNNNTLIYVGLGVVAFMLLTKKSTPTMVYPPYGGNPGYNPGNIPQQSPGFVNTLVNLFKGSPGHSQPSGGAYNPDAVNPATGLTYAGLDPYTGLTPGQLDNYIPDSGSNSGSSSGSSSSDSSGAAYGHSFDELFM